MREVVAFTVDVDFAVVVAFDVAVTFTVVVVFAASVSFLRDLASGMAVGWVVVISGTVAVDSCCVCVKVGVTAGVDAELERGGDVDAATVAVEPVKPLHAASIQHSSRAHAPMTNLFMLNSFRL